MSFKAPSWKRLIGGYHMTPIDFSKIVLSWRELRPDNHSGAHATASGALEKP